VKWCATKLSLGPRWPGNTGLTSWRQEVLRAAVEFFRGELMTRQSILRSSLFHAFAAIPVICMVSVNNVYPTPDLTTVHFVDVGLLAGMLIFFAQHSAFGDFPDA
jgi:hypothetical protein